jgi:hypothetical protein
MENQKGSSSTGFSADAGGGYSPAEETVMDAAFFLNLVIALMSGAIAYGVLKTDLKNTIERLNKETELREEHEKQDDETHHDIRGEVGLVSQRVAVIEGRLEQRQ